MDVDHLVARAPSDRDLSAPPSSCMRINQLVAQLQESVRQQASMIDDQGARLRNLETVIARALVSPSAPGAASAIAVSVASDSPATPAAAGAPTAVGMVEARDTVAALCTVAAAERNRAAPCSAVHGGSGGAEPCRIGAHAIGASASGRGGSVLNFNAVACVDTRQGPYPDRSFSRRATHIEAYMAVSGQQMALAGVGCEQGIALATWGLIPTHWTAQQLTATQQWVRLLATKPDKGEKVVSGIHYEHMPSGWAPRQVWFQRSLEGQVESLIATAQDDPARCHAEWIVLAQAVAPIEVQECSAVEVDMEAVSTPRTPDPFDSDASWSPRSGPPIFRTVSSPERPLGELAAVSADGPLSSRVQHGTEEVFIEGLTSLFLSCDGAGFSNRCKPKWDTLDVLLQEIVGGNGSLDCDIIFTPGAKYFQAGAVVQPHQNKVLTLSQVAGVCKEAIILWFGKHRPLGQLKVKLVPPSVVPYECTEAAAEQFGAHAPTCQSAGAGASL